MNLIFTDLHISDTNINTCEEFLKSILNYLDKEE